MFNTGASLFDQKCMEISLVTHHIFTEVFRSLLVCSRSHILRIIDASKKPLDFVANKRPTLSSIKVIGQKKHIQRIIRLVMRIALNWWARHIDQMCTCGVKIKLPVKLFNTWQKKVRTLSLRSMLIGL